MIERVTINNVQCFKNMDIPLTGRDVVVAHNGRGKTTLLNSITLAATDQVTGLCKATKDIVGMMRGGEETMDVGIHFRDGTKVTRRFYKTPDGNKEEIYIDDKKHKTGKGNQLIAEKISDNQGHSFIVRFKVASFVDKTEIEMKKYLWTIFSEKLKGGDLSELKAEITTEVYKLLVIASGKASDRERDEKTYNAMIRMKYGTNYDNLTQPQKVEWIKIMQEQSEKDYDMGDVTASISEIINKVPDAPIPQFMDILVGEVNVESKNMQSAKLETGSAIKVLKEDQESIMGLGSKEKELERSEAKITSLKEAKMVRENKIEALKVYDRTMKLMEDTPVDQERLMEVKKLIEKDASIKKKYEEAENELEILRGKEKMLKPQLSLLNEKEEHEKDIARYKKEVTISEFDKENLDVSLIEDETTYKEVSGQLMEKEELLEKLIVKIEKLSKKKVSLESLHKQLSQTIKTFKNGKCPMCETPVDKITMNLEKVTKQYDKVCKDIKELPKIEDMKSKKNKLEDMIDKIKATMSILSASIEQAKANILNADRNIIVYTGKIDEIKRTITDMNITLTADEKNELYDAMSKAETNINNNSVAYNGVVALEKERDNIIKAIEENKEKKQKRNSLVKPTIPDIDETTDITILSLEERVKILKIEIKKARENVGIEKKIVDLGEVYSKQEAASKFLNSVEKLLFNMKQGLIGRYLSPVAKKASEIYTRVYPGEVYFTDTGCGITQGGDNPMDTYRSYRYLSDGEKVIFSISIISTIMDETETKERCLLVEANELDSVAINKLMETLKDVNMENVIVTTFPKETVNEEAVPKGWNMIRF